MTTQPGEVSTSREFYGRGPYPYPKGSVWPGGGILGVVDIYGDGSRAPTQARTLSTLKNKRYLL